MMTALQITGGKVAKNLLGIFAVHSAASSVAMDPKMISSGPTVLMRFVTRHPTNRPGTASGRKKGSTVSASEKRHWMGP